MSIDKLYNSGVEALNQCQVGFNNLDDDEKLTLAAKVCAIAFVVGIVMSAKVGILAGVVALAYFCYSAAKGEKKTDKESGLDVGVTVDEVNGGLRSMRENGAAGRFVADCTEGLLDAAKAVAPKGNPVHRLSTKNWFQRQRDKVSNWIAAKC